MNGSSMSGCMIKIVIHFMLFDMLLNNSFHVIKRYFAERIVLMNKKTLVRKVRSFMNIKGIKVMLVLVNYIERACRLVDIKLNAAI
jgi:predicted phosphohydrolase